MSRGSSKSSKRPALPASSRATFLTARAKPFGYLFVALDDTDPNNVSVVPGIPIVIHGPTGRIPLTGLVDSGADSLVMPMVIAKSLGIEKSKCKKMRCLGVGGKGYQYIWPQGIEYEVQPMNRTRVTAVAAFAEGLPSSIALLGREDFFQVFKVAIDQRINVFWLEKYA
jgi:hypothetical protein